MTYGSFRFEFLKFVKSNVDCHLNLQLAEIQLLDRKEVLVCCSRSVVWTLRSYGPEIHGRMFQIDLCRVVDLTFDKDLTFGQYVTN